MNKSKLLTLLILISLLAAVFGSSAQAQDRVQIRWFVGLGAGSDAQVVAPQEAFVEEFNNSQDKIELILEIVDNEQAYDVLATQIAAGNAPDIVGPMGIRGRASFPGVWMDLTPLIEAASYDLSDFDPALINFYKVEGEGQLGIPFAVFPSFMMYNKDHFDEAGIPYPPTAYGEPYIDWEGNERPWDLNTIRDIAMLLTVDSGNNDATMEEFNPDDIVQFGFGVQFSDLRGRDTLFGAGNFVDAESNAVIPEQWAVAEQWYHQAMWEDYFYPNGVYANSELLGGEGGNWFNSGNISMITIHTWFLGWGTADLEAAWDFAPVPAYEGVTTAKLHADTFSIMNSSEHPEEAFAVLAYMLGEKSQELTSLYGGMPARLSLQPDYFTNFVATQTEAYPNVDWANLNWQMVADGLAYPDNPNHEEGMPNFLEASARYTEYLQIADKDAEFDVLAGLETLRTDLQAIFDAAE